MANRSASELAGNRIRQARQRRGWTARELADRCAKAGAPQISATVVTNLETRRRGTRQITVEELLALARVLEVPPLELIAPLDAGEELEILPGDEMAPLDAVRWIAGDAAADLVRVTSSPVADDTGKMLRLGDPGSALTAVRQIGIVSRRIAGFDGRLREPALAAYSESVPRYESYIAVMADRLMHLAARMQALGYDPPVPDSVREILRARGLPATLAQWRRQRDSREEETGAED